MFEPDTLSIGSVDNPGTVQEEEENPPLEGSCPNKDAIENNRNKISNREDVESPYTRSKENSVEDEGDSAEMVFTKEKLRQESKESDTAEANHVSTLLEIIIFFCV